MGIVRVDEKGRILIPRRLREKTGIREGSYVRVELDGERVIITPVTPNSEKYFGVFKVSRWPRDLDEFIVEAMRRWWLPKAT